MITLIIPGGLNIISEDFEQKYKGLKSAYNLNNKITFYLKFIVYLQTTARL